MGKQRLIRRLFLGALGLLAGSCLVTGVAGAATETVLHRFRGGQLPDGSVITDSAGNVYGTTTGGGSGKNGSVYQLTPPATPGGKWTRTTLYAFTGQADGGFPQGQLIFDAAGNLYGVAGIGGVFQMSPPASAGGPWTESIIYSVMQGGLYDTLAFDAAGNLYGVILKLGKHFHTSFSIFQLARPASPGGAWTPTILYEFTKGGKEGAFPGPGVVVDASGNLYGTTDFNGVKNQGTVFQLAPPASPGGAWTYNVIHAFSKKDGNNPSPYANLMIDASGNLYGATGAGGTHGNGTVFELSPPASPGGKWTETILYAFKSKGDAKVPSSSLIADAAGNLYGEAEAGGTYGLGCIFKLTPPAAPNTPWTETLIFSFRKKGDGGDGPFGGLALDAAGNLYGLNSDLANKGRSVDGTVFQVTP